MKTHLMVLCVSFLCFVSCRQSGSNSDNQALGQGHPYFFKSGILYYSAELPGSMGLIKRTLYIDDFGRKSKMVVSTSLQQGQVLQQHRLVLGDQVYMWSDGEGSGIKMPLDSVYDPWNISFTPLDQQAQQRFNIVEQGKEKLNKVVYDVFELEFQGLKATFWVHENVIVKSRLSMMGMYIMEELQEQEMGADIPVQHFELPNITWRDVQVKGSPLEIFQ